MWLEPRYMVAVAPFLPGAETPLGEPVDAWGEPVEHAVYGWSPPSPDDVLRDTQTGVARALTLYTPEAITGPRDRVLVDGVEYKAVGYPQDYNHGPFGWQPGFAARLDSVEG